MSPHIEEIGSCLIEATRDVFRDSGVSLADARRCDPVVAWLDPIAVIGFGGEALRGSVSFEVPWRLLQASHPTHSMATEDLADWVGELANLVLGRLKRRLRAREVVIQLGLPMTFTTQASQSCATTSPELQYRLPSDDGSVLVRFSAEADAGFRLAPPAPAEPIESISLF